MELYVGQFLVFMMLFVRITAVIVVAPVLGHQSVPVQIKVALGIFLAFVMYPIAAGKAPVINADLISLGVMVLREVAVGLTIGFATSLVFVGVRFAGELISVDSGLSIASLFDPEMNSQSSVISEFLYLIMLMVFLLVNGHHFVLEALYLSYAAVPIGDFAFNGTAAQLLIKLSGFTFIVAMKLAAPVMVAMFLVNVALSILSRVMPQMNIFTLAFPIHIGAGFFAMMVASPLLVLVFKNLLAGFEESVFELVKAL